MSNSVGSLETSSQVSPSPSLAPAASDTSEGTLWETAADELCAAMLLRAQDVCQRAGEKLYEELLYNTQDFLRDNIAFNLSGELARAKQQAEDARAALVAVAKALEVPFIDWMVPTSSIRDRCIFEAEKLRAALQAAGPVPRVGEALATEPKGDRS